MHGTKKYDIECPNIENKKEYFFRKQKLKQA